MGNLFNMDNGFWRAMGKVADIIILNILFIICCIPIVTIGASYTALYTVMLKLVKNEESYIAKGFFKAFKANFKQATIIWLILLFAGIFLVVDLYLTNFIEGTFMSVLHYIFIAFLFIYAAMFSYVFPILSKFDNTIKNTIKNSLLMSIAHFPWTIVVVAVTALPIVIILFVNMNFVFGVLLPFMIFAGFAVLAFVKSHIFNRIFKRYIPGENEEDETSEESDCTDDSDEEDTYEIEGETFDAIETDSDDTIM